MRFGFIAHITNKDEYNMLRSISQLSKLSFEVNQNKENPSLSIDLIEFSITSACGNKADGKVTYLPLYPEEIINKDKMSSTLEKLKSVALALESWGADIIGLGGYLAAIGGRGVEVQQALQTAKITTGNTFTAAISIDTVAYIMNCFGGEKIGKNITVVGFPGSIALAISKVMLRSGHTVTVVGRQNSPIAKEFLESFNEQKQLIRFTTELADALRCADVVFSATTTGNLINCKDLKSGSVVIDIGAPRDVIADSCCDDVLVVDGGRFSLAESVKTTLPLSFLLRNNYFGCLGETMLIALEEKTELCTIGRVISETNLSDIRKVAQKNGFLVNSITSFGLPVSKDKIHELTKFFSQSTRDGGCIFDKSSVDKDIILSKFAKHINSVKIAMAQVGKIDRVYTSAKGAYVWDTDGAKYLDCVGGYGSVNIGHNHPELQANITKYFTMSPPSVLQVSAGYFATLLAEKLSEALPESLERVFLCNSGTEAVEGALKIARIYTRRTKFVSTKNSFHGKTIGALSLTGREQYQQFFRPLLNEVDFIEYNDTTALESILSSEEYAAFIVEPIQGEGGINVPDDGFLVKCAEICKKFGTLFIIDEVQTGFGRTGKLFAIEHENVQPDVITVAKALGGALIPLGAYITTQEIWNKAYGSSQKYLLHSSTFGGNNFCATVGLSTMHIINNEGLVENARYIGNILKEGLNRLANEYSFIKEIRGKGLLLGIEFDYNIDNGIRNIANLISSMIPESVRKMLLAMPDSVACSLHSFVDDNIECIENYLRDSFASQFAAQLLNEHQIITLVTLNNPNVMRLEPPLVISKDDAIHFLRSMRCVCEQFAFQGTNGDTNAFIETLGNAFSS